jgi:hypothetical protein
MNIFVLHPDPFVAAEMHCDKHVVKMIVEYAQLLSTAHRLLDGMPVAAELNGKTKHFLLLPGETIGTKTTFVEHVDEEACEVMTFETQRLVIENAVCYNATHANHPSAVWARQNGSNYLWLLHLFTGCLMEYTHRYGKTHASSKLLQFFAHPPKNMVYGEQTPFPQAMPPEYQVPNDPIAAYQAFYVGSKSRFAKWTNRAIPEFFAAAITKEGRDVSEFERTR